MREHLGGVLRTPNGEDRGGGDTLSPEEQLWVMGTVCPQGGIWVGMLRSPVEGLGELRTPQWRCWGCWGSQREELRISGTSHPPSPMEQLWVLRTSKGEDGGPGDLPACEVEAGDVGDSLPLKEQHRVLGPPKEGAGGVQDPQKCSWRCWRPPAHPPLM